MACMRIGEERVAPGACDRVEPIRIHDKTGVSFRTTCRPLGRSFGVPTRDQPRRRGEPSSGGPASAPFASFAGAIYRPVSLSLRTWARRSAVSRVMVRRPLKNRDRTERSTPASRASS
jgi:hypothetical protein